MSQNLVAKINQKHCALYSAMAKVLELNMFKQLSLFSTNKTTSAHCQKYFLLQAESFISD